MSNLKDKVVVITGASSGIGRASALEFAKHGAKLVLAARRGEALEELARECAQLGTRAIAVQTDVSDEAQVEALARTAEEQLGGIDVWVNNAAVSALGSFDEVPTEAFRRVLDVNLMGYVHGVKAALPRLRARERGVIINVSSMVGKIGQAHTAAYVTSKFGIVGMSETLWQELRHEPIDVVTILPAAIDTPIYQQAANYTGKRIEPIDPVYPADMVAGAIVKAAIKPEREIFVGPAGRALATLHQFAPPAASRLIAHKVEEEHIGDEPAAITDGALYEPMPQYASVSGGWKDVGEKRPQRTAMLVGGAVLVGASLLAWRMMRNGDRQAQDMDLQGEDLSPNYVAPSEARRLEHAL